MSDSFDPYSEWLGIHGGDRPPDRYRLLGLRQFESDPELIAHAAVAAMAQVRRIRPGDHLAQWSKLLDELGAAKKCLLDPAAKASYDAGLKERPAASPPAKDPLTMLPEPAVKPAKQYDIGLKEEIPLSPVGGKMPTFTPGPAAKSAKQYDDIGFADEGPASRVGGKPTKPSPGLAPAKADDDDLVFREESPASGRTKPSRIADDSDADASQGYDLGLKVESSASLKGSTATAKSYRPASKSDGDYALTTDRPGHTTRSRASPRASWNGPIGVGVILLALGIGGAMLNDMLRQNAPVTTNDQPGGPGSENVSPVNPPPGAPPARPPVSKGSRNQPTLRLTPSGLQPGGPTAPASVEEPSVLHSQPMPQASTAALNPEGARSRPAAEGASGGGFAPSVAAARAALAARNLDAARTQIKAASAAARTPDESEQVDRLETMLDHLTQFWDGVRAALARLQPADEIVVDHATLTVVESNKDYLKVKTGGRYQEYRAETLPTPLVWQIVQRYFGKDPGSKAVIATFLAVDPQGSRALAARYWQEASQAGIDCEKLLREVDERTQDR